MLRDSTGKNSGDEQGQNDIDIDEEYGSLERQERSSADDGSLYEPCGPIATAGASEAVTAAVILKIVTV